MLEERLIRREQPVQDRRREMSECCACCGGYTPEGTMLCWACEKELSKPKNN